MPFVAWAFKKYKAILTLTKGDNPVTIQKEKRAVRGTALKKAKDTNTLATPHHFF